MLVQHRPTSSSLPLLQPFPYSHGSSPPHAVEHDPLFPQPPKEQDPWPEMVTPKHAPISLCGLCWDVWMYDKGEGRHWVHYSWHRMGELRPCTFIAPSPHQAGPLSRPRTAGGEGTLPAPPPRGGREGEGNWGSFKSWAQALHPVLRSCLDQAQPRHRWSQVSPMTLGSPCAFFPPLQSLPSASGPLVLSSPPPPPAQWAPSP